MAAPGALPAGPVDVAIVGAGPTGLTLANLLAAQGLSVAIIERQHGVQPLPRAVHLDGETMRILHAAGASAEALAVTRASGAMHWVNAEGRTLLVRQGPPGLGPQGWHHNYYYHQPSLESALRRALARQPSVQLCEGWVLSGLEDSSGDAGPARASAPPEPVALRLLPSDDGNAGRAPSTGDGAAGGNAAPGPATLHARWVVGCDGARSTVRSLAGLDAFDDLGAHQTWVVVDAALHRPLDLPEHSVQHCDPARPATAVFVHALRRRWELMLLPGDDPQAIVQPENLWPLLARWVRPGQGVLERAACYTFHSLVARSWQRGRVLIAGDAAHQTPPFIGQGLCAGLRDAHNLAWKLAAAVRRPGPTADALVATYGPERAPHARHFVQLAVEVGRIIQVTDPAEAAARDARLAGDPQTFAFPTPPLGPGAHRARPAAPQVGQVAPQFETGDGTWSDDAAPGRWSAWLAPALAAGLPGALRQRLQDLGIVALADLGPRGQAWLHEQGVQAALLRPDRYLFDLCADAAGFAAAVDAATGWMPPAAPAAVPTEGWP